MKDYRIRYICTGYLADVSGPPNYSTTNGSSGINIPDVVVDKQGSNESLQSPSKKLASVKGSFGPSGQLFKLPQVYARQDSIDDMKDCEVDKRKPVANSIGNKLKQAEKIPEKTDKPPSKSPQKQSPRTVSLQELKLHNSKQDAWTCIRGSVYNVTNFISRHPGGASAIMKILGSDGTKLFGTVSANLL